MPWRELKVFFIYFFLNTFLFFLQPSHSVVHFPLRKVVEKPRQQQKFVIKNVN